MQRRPGTPMFVFLSVLFSSSLFAQVSWVRKFDDALKQAQAESKLIVVDIFTDWCPPCREMAQKVYTDREFIDFSRSQIYMMLNAEKDSEGMRLSRKFDVHNYPTILILDAKGQEIDRLIGGRNTKAFIRDLRSIFENPMPYGELVKKAKESPDDYALQRKAGERAFERKEYTLARQFLGRAAGKSNKDPASQVSALLLLSTACYKDAKYPEALTALDEFERMAPDEAARDSELKLLRGRILISCKRYDEGNKVLADFLRSSRSREEIESARKAMSQLPGKYRKENKEYGNILEKSRQEYQKGKLESALSLARQASDMAPQSAQVHLVLALINFQMGTKETDDSKKGQLLSTGLNELRFARRLDPEDMSIYSSAKEILASRYLRLTPAPAAKNSYLQAENLFAQGRYADAVNAYKKTIELDPGFGKAYLHCGDCFFTNGKIEEALNLYQAAIAQSPIDASAYRFAADALTKLGRGDEARRYVVLSLLADPEYPMVWQDLERVASSQGSQLRRHPDLVPIQFLLLGIDANSYDENIYDNLPPQSIPAWREYVRSKLLWRQEKFAQVFPKETFYHTSFEEENESLQAAVTKWEGVKTQDPSLRDEGLDFLHQISVDGQLAAFIYLELFTEEYRSSYEQWKKNNPESGTKYVQEYLTGRTGIPSKGEYNASAIEAYNNAITLHKAGNNEEAIKLYLKAIAQAPGMVPALRNLGILYFQMNDFANARGKIEQWSAAEPNEVDPLAMLAQIQFRERNYEKALEYLKKALTLVQDPAKKSQLQRMLSGIQSAAGIRERESDPDE